MFRYISVLLAFLPLAYSQNQASFEWIRQIDAASSDTFAGLGVDAAGNTYIAGSTASQTFPVQAAVQNHLASSGLYQVTGPGSAYTPLSISAATFAAIDPRNANTLYVISSTLLLKSLNAGASFTQLKPPTSQPENITIDPSNGQILYLGSFDQGLLKSTDGGVTWAASNGTLQPLEPGQFAFQNVWIDPTMPNVLLANAIGNFIRSADAGTTWQTILPDTDVLSVTFDTANPGVVYASNNQGSVSKSVDHGQTFTPLTTPTPFGVVSADPNRPGRLVALSLNAIEESDDGGNTWAVKVNLPFPVNTFFFAADWANGYLYAASSSAVLRITTNLANVTPVGPPSIGGFISSIAAANGIAYVADAGSNDVYVTKLDPTGSVVYSTYFGGTGNDIVSAMTVDAAGNVYVTGSTTSLDFPVTKGAYASTGSSFLFRLNPDGTVGYSTYATQAPFAIAVDSSGAAYIAGNTEGSLPTTPGAYQATCSDCGLHSTGFFGVISESGFVSKFDPTGSTLVYSTYIGGAIEFENSLGAFALGPDGTAYVAGANGVFHLSASGAALLGSLPQLINPQSMGVAPDGSVYVVGAQFPNSSSAFQTTAGAFETSINLPPSLPYQMGASPSLIGHWDSQLANLLDATYFGACAKSINSITFDVSGNVYLGGSTVPQGLPARTPIQAGFASGTGFMSELSGDLSTLLFSSYFGDTHHFGVGGVAVRRDGTVVLGGSTSSSTPAPSAIYVNSLTVAPPPALRIDSVQNAASMLDGQIAPGETILVQGAGFATGAQLSIGGVAVTPISVTTTTIAAVVPQSVPGVAAEVQVQSAGASSNQVLIPVASAAPGIFTQNGSGFGQGYILNKDGTLNTPSNAANPGDPITIFATGVGPVSFSGGYAVSQFPVNVFVYDFFCYGVAAVMGPVSGFPGSVYQITVYAPNPATLVANNPDLKNFKFPPTVGITMQVNGVSSQIGVALSISQ